MSDGKCYRCGKPVALKEDGSPASVCPRHQRLCKRWGRNYRKKLASTEEGRAKIKATTNTYRERRRKLGLCLRCDNPVWRKKDGGPRELCRRHVILQNASTRALRSTPEGKKHDHFLKDRHRKRRKQLGLCTCCKTPVEIKANGKPGVLCPHHALLNRQRAARIVAALGVRKRRERWRSGMRRFLKLNPTYYTAKEIRRRRKLRAK